MSDEQKPNLIMENKELRRQLQEMAMLDFEKFLLKIGADQIQIFVCAEAMKSRSYQAIMNSLNRHGIKLTRQAVGARCRKCK